MRNKSRKIKIKSETDKKKEKKKQDYLDITLYLSALGFNKRFS